jgi:hypothetical protein
MKTQSEHDDSMVSNSIVPYLSPTTWNSQTKQIRLIEAASTVSTHPMTPSICRFDSRREVTLLDPQSHVFITSVCHLFAETLLS